MGQDPLLTGQGSKNLNDQLFEANILELLHSGSSPPQQAPIASVPESDVARTIVELHRLLE